MDWIKTSDKLPEEWKSVFLTKKLEVDLNNANIGFLLKNDEGVLGWHVGNDLFLKVHARNFWIYLEETDITVPITKTDEELQIVLEYYLDRLSLFDKKFMYLAKGMIQSGAGLYQLDYYISGVLNRCMSLIYGFDTLIRSRNFISAAHLVRPHLDNYLRLSAAWLVDKPHDFALKVLQGGRIDKIKDQNGQLMRDAYLVKMASVDYPWIEKVYSETSGFVHFSNKHILQATSASFTEENTLTTYIGKIDNNVLNESKIEACIGMIEISNCIAKQVFGWISTKRFEKDLNN